jgi:hypothetical protein
MPVDKGEAEEQAFERGKTEREPQQEKTERPAVRHRPDRVEVLRDRVVHPREYPIKGEERVASQPRDPQRL